MKKLVSYHLIAIVAVLPAMVLAQGLDSIKPWTITNCLEYAKAHNIEINTLRLEERASLQDLAAAKAASLPSLYGSVTNLFNNANNPVNNGLVNQLTSSGTYSINSSVLIWNDNYLKNNIRQKELLSLTAKWGIEQAENNITFRITQAYLEILLAKENLKYNTDLVSTSGAILKQAQMFYDAGSIAKKDLLQLQAQYAGDKYLLVQTENAIRLNILVLKQILQLSAEVPFDVLTPDSVTISYLLITLNEVRQAALNHFPEIRISRAELDVASLDITKLKAAFKPSLYANGALGTGYSEVLVHPVDSKTGYLRQVGNEFYQRIGLTLSFPIYSNRINKTNLEKARIQFKAAGLRLENEKLILSQAVEQAYLNATNAIQSYLAADQQLMAATESYRITNEQFKLGAINIYDLLQQRNQYILAVQAFTQAKYSAILQRKIYEYYVGIPVTL